MPGPPAVSVALSDPHRELLKEIARRPKSSQRLACRAQILLEAADGTPNEEIGRRLGLNLATIRCWRRRGAETSARLDDLEAALRLDGTTESKIGVMIRQALEAALDDAPRPGAPAKFTAEHIVAIVAIACEDPDKYGRPVTHWTPRELADEVLKQKIVPQISVRSVGRFLKGGRPQAPPEPLLAEPGDRGRGGVPRGGGGRL